MKKSLFLMTLLMCLSLGASAQWVWQPLDTTGTDTFWGGPYQNGPTGFVNVSNNTTDKVEGAASLQIDYRVEAFDGWGGYGVRAVDNSTKPGRVDLSSGKYLSFWYKVVTGAVKSAPGELNFEFKVQDKTTEAGRDLWLHGFGTIMESAGPWTQVMIPLEEKTGAVSNWNLQFGDDNKKFEPWANTGYEVAFVYIPTAGGGPSNTPFVTGTVLFDKLQIIGAKNQVVMSFDESTVADTTTDRTKKDAFWQLGDMSWDGAAGARHMIMSKENVDTVQGTQALKIDYAIVGSQDWGGYAEIDHIFPNLVDMSGKTALNFYLKNLEANTLTGRFALRVELYDEENGVLECWSSIANVDMDKTSDWQLVTLPFSAASKPWYDLRKGDLGFIQRDDPKNGGIFSIDKIKKIRIGFIVFHAAGEPFGPTVIANGKFLIDFMTPSGFKDNDITAPKAPEDLFGLAADYSNLISWTDLTGETGETYNLFYSQSSITDIAAPGVYALARSVARGKGAAEHILYSPLIDRPTENYYAIYAKDASGNFDVAKGLSSLASSVSNTAKGIPVVYNIAPAGFKADGKLSDWAGIQPWVLKTDDGSGHKVGWTVHDGDADLWFKAWIAIANDSMYVAYEVHDDIVFTDSTKDSYNQDAPDLFISFYPYKGKDHIGYTSGSSPDYHYRFDRNAVHDEVSGGAKIQYPGKNYFWGEVDGLAGYVVEYRVSLNDIATFHAGDTKFVPMEKMQIALDFNANDGDATGAREGIVTWSPLNEDAAYKDVTQWAYSWIGNANTDFVSVNGTSDGIASDFRLNQNYPNPFNPTTTITYNVVLPSEVTVKVFNVLGAEIATIASGFHAAKEYKVSFDGSKLSSGIYFVKMEAKGFNSVRKMMLIK